MKLVTARSTSHLIERDDELRRLGAAIDTAAEGVGTLVIVEGLAGMGRTALLDYCHHAATTADMIVLQTTASEFETEYCFGTALTLFLGHLTGCNTDARAAAYQGRAATCEHLLERGIDGESLSDQECFAITDGLFWLTSNIAAARPVVILVDDAHWADDASLRFLGYLARRLRSLSVTMVLGVASGAARTNPVLSSLIANDSTSTLRVRPLTEAGVRAYLNGIAPDFACIEGFSSECARLSGGNPLLVHELVASLRDHPCEGATLMARLQDDVPVAIRRQVASRLGQLGPHATALAQACAVLQQETTLDLAAALAGMTVEGAARAADTLVECGILGVNESITFAQPLVGAAIYAELSDGSRAVAHARAASLLRQAGVGGDVVSDHLLRGAPVSERWAADALQSGAVAAARAGSPATAASYLRRAIVADVPERRRGQMLRDLGLLEAASGETELALSRLQSASQLIVEPAERAKCLYALGVTLYRDGRHGEAAHMFQECAILAENTDGDLALTASGAWIFTAYYLDGVPPAALTRLEELSTTICKQGASSAADRSVLAVSALRSAMTLPPAVHGAELAAEALTDGLLFGRHGANSVAAQWAVLALVYSGQLDEAALAIDDVLTDARDFGNLPAVAEGSLIRSFVHLARGNVTDAYADARVAVEGVDKGWYGLAPLAFGTLAQCCVERDDPEEAEAVLRAAEAFVQSNHSHGAGLRSWIAMGRGRLHFYRGDMKSALDDFLSAGETLSAFGTTNPAVMRWRSMAGLAANAIGDTQMAAELIDEELCMARAFGLEQEVGAALRTKSAVATGRRRESLLRESLAVLERSGNSALDLAETLCALGAEVRRLGKRSEAREILSKAMDTAHRNGAVAIARRARDELLATGAKPRRPTISGIESLTPTELRIARLAADGLTNPEIARELYLAKSTIAWHLRHVYLKLQIESRAELVGSLGSHTDKAAPLMDVAYG